MYELSWAFLPRTGTVWNGLDWGLSTKAIHVLAFCPCGVDVSAGGLWWTFQVKEEGKGRGGKGGGDRGEVIEWSRLHSTLQKKGGRMVEG